MGYAAGASGMIGDSAELGHPADTVEGARSALERRERDRRGGWRYLGQPGDAWLLFGALGLAALADPIAMRAMGVVRESTAAGGRSGDLGEAPVPVARAGAVALPAAAEAEPAAAGPVFGSSGGPAPAFGGGFSPAVGSVASAPGIAGGGLGIGIASASGVSVLSFGEAGLSATIAFSAGVAQAGPAPIQVLQVVVPPPMVVQVNMSTSDHDAVAVAVAITRIETITDSIVFIGGNTAIASAVNIAPVIQANGLEALFGSGSFGGWGSSGWGAGPGSGFEATQLNLSRSDNDAVAIAISASFVGTAVNSIVVFLGNDAQASAFNFAPVVQSNDLAVVAGGAPTGGAAPLPRLFAAFDDAAFGAGHEAALPGAEKLPDVASAERDLLGDALGTALRSADNVADALGPLQEAATAGLFPSDLVELAGLMET